LLLVERYVDRGLPVISRARWPRRTFLTGEDLSADDRTPESAGPVELSNDARDESLRAFHVDPLLDASQMSTDHTG
jgi:hypothetical protein